MYPLPCIIFAGGKSSRMGRNKALLPFGASPTLAEYQYRRFAPLFEKTFLSVKSSEPFSAGIPVIIDDPSSEGFAPTAGFIAVFHALDNDRVCVISVDTPFVDDAVISALLAADREDIDAVIARTRDGVHPLCGIYHRRLLPRFETMAESGDHKLGRMLNTSDVVYVDFDSEAPFANLNHPHEYEAALKKAGPDKR